jgi:hypothetical protein
VDLKSPMEQQYMSRSRTQLGIAYLIICGAGIVLISQYRSQTALHDENELLLQKLAQLEAEHESLSNRYAGISGAPAPNVPVQPVPAGTSQSAQQTPVTNLIALLLSGGEAPRLTAAQVQHYLEENHRSATSLLSAYRTSGERALLEEAMQKYPGDPEVAFEAVLRKDASPTERREWLEAFKRAAPENPLPDYFSALDYFKSGQTDQAVQELMTASSRQGFSDYTVERIQTDAEAYRAAGYSEGEAKMAATWGVTLPQLIEMKTLAQNAVDMAASYRQAGDQNSSQAMLQVAIGLGQQLDASSGTCVPLVTRLVGIAIERMAFGSIDPSSGYGDGTIQQQVDQLIQRRNSIQDLVKQSEPFQQQMTPEDWLSYNERTVNFGEEKAIGWLLAKYGRQ